MNDWYVPWDYSIHHGEAFRVEVRNGAGQRVVERLFKTRKEAERWIDKHKQQRQESFT